MVVVGGAVYTTVRAIICRDKHGGFGNDDVDSTIVEITTILLLCREEIKNTIFKQKIISATRLQRSHGNYYNMEFNHNNNN